MKNVKRTTKTIPCADIDLHRKLKKAAADDGIPLQLLVAQLLSDGLELREKAA